MKKGDLIKNRRTGRLGIVYDSSKDSARKLLVRVYYEESQFIWVRAANFTIVKAARGSSAKEIATENWEHIVFNITRHDLFVRGNNV